MLAVATRRFPVDSSRFASALLLAALPVLAACATTGPGNSPTPTEAATIEEVIFPGPDFELVGTLHLPARAAGAAVPGIVLIHGSGPNSRAQPVAGQLTMGFGFTIEVFTELAEALSERGYAVLRYDKRSCGTFNDLCDNDYPLPGPDILVTDFADDARAALDYLAIRPEADPERLVPIGLSQGCNFIPALLSDDPALPAGVMLAGNHRPIDEIVTYQLEFTIEYMEQLGYTQQQIDAALADLQTMSDDLAELRAGTFAGASIAGVSTAFWQSWFDLNDAAPGLATALDRPILALSGDYDFNIPPVETQAWQSTFDAAAPNPGHRASVLPCLTHAFNCISQPDRQAVMPSDIGRNLAPEAVQAVTEFLDGAGAGP